MRIKRIFVCFAALCLLLLSVMSACSPVSSDSEEPSIITPQSGDDLSGEILEPVPSEIVPIIDDKEDSSDPLSTSLSLDGDFVQLSSKAEKTLLASGVMPSSMYELEDGGVILAYTMGSWLDASVVLQKIDPKTGKQLILVQYDLHTNVSYYKDVRGLEGYDKYDLQISTMDGVYLVDFENLAKAPEAFLASGDKLEELGRYDFSINIIGTPEGTQEGSTASDFILYFESVDVYAPDKKFVACTNDGIYYGNLDGSGVEKIADQFDKGMWFKDASSLHSEISDLIRTRETQARLSQPRFFDNGKKIVFNLTSYEVVANSIGFVVLDLETKQLNVQNYYDKDTTMGSVSDYDTFMSFSFSMPWVALNESEIDVRIGNVLVEEGDVRGRFDIIYNINTGKIRKKAIAYAGISFDYRYFVVNNTSSTVKKISFFDNEKQSLTNGGVYVGGEVLSKGMAVSANYAVIQVWKADDASNPIDIIALVPKD
ncbi:MAG: hypothetical protein LBC56_08030 [Oscillospiraceae bacterium]|jgi:hypothetical protein|nr:hypothetical protein [Oscillospiraceae bacterium]